MLHCVVAVFDKAVQAYAKPMFVPALGAALRAFEDEVIRPDSEMGKHPEDYAMFHIGTYDDSSAELEKIEPLCIRRAHEVNRGLEAVNA
jgi:hypothetical protein